MERNSREIQSLEDVDVNEMGSNELVKLSLRGSFTQSLFIRRFSTWGWEVHPDFMPPTIKKRIGRGRQSELISVRIISVVRVGRPVFMAYGEASRVMTDPLRSITVCHYRDAFHDSIVLH